MHGYDDASLSKRENPMRTALSQFRKSSAQQHAGHCFRGDDRQSLTHSLCCVDLDVDSLFEGRYVCWDGTTLIPPDFEA